jgi:hypothetical protein
LSLPFAKPFWQASSVFTAIVSRPLCIETQGMATSLLAENPLA